VYLDPTSHLPYATVMLPIYDGQGHFTCVLAHDMHLDRLIHEVTRSDYPGAVHMIFRTDGRMIAHAQWHEAILASDGLLTVQDSGDPALVSLHALLTAAGPAHRSGFEPVSKSYYSASKLHLPGADWHFVTLMPRREVALRTLQSSQWVIWSGAVLLGLLLAFLASVLRNQVSKPLAELTLATQQMATGTAQILPVKPRADELGVFAVAFQQMVQRVIVREGELRQLNTNLEQRVADRTAELAQALEREKALGEMKSNFVSLVSHEFRTPLGVIMSASEVLNRYFERLQPEKRQRHLAMIFKSTRNLAALIDEVLLLGRVEEGRMSFKPEPLNLEKFCRSLGDEMCSATGGVCPIQLHVESDLSGAVSDEAVLRHILTNLLSNACKYSEPGSPVRFTVGRVGDDAHMVITDSGIGIPEADLERLFTSFSRGSNVGARPGTGLGLVVVRRCVDLHGGTLLLQSEVGKGTTATVTLPIFFQPT
jgi:signal transduction histidine kinase